ncbi:nodulation protein NfeD [Candidatus Bipolaricaulota bacterium]|nr:nodulation protein NfeD [Candidatus Bipolaricaulota bacterium]
MTRTTTQRGVTFVAVTKPYHAPQPHAAGLFVARCPPYTVRIMRILSLCAICVLIIGMSVVAQSEILRLELNTSINPISKDIVIRTIREAESVDAALVVIELNTPGGLDQSTRDIVAAILGSSVPIVVFVSPSGARAASAGTFITMAADIAAMAPGTNIGAAHPVSLIGGGDGDASSESTSMDKAANDSAAFARSIAEQRGRNVEWAEAAVLESSSLSASEALEANVIDLIADDFPGLLRTLDGREVKGKILNTLRAQVREIRPSLRERLLGLLADPNLVYLLFILGLYGLIYEFFQPGIGFGLAAGGVCLLLALFGLQILPVNIAGIALVLFGMALMVLDTFTPTNGILTLGGVAALLIGSLTLFNIPDRSIGLSLGTIFAVVGLSAAFTIFVLSKGLMIQRKRPVTGINALIGAVGVVRRDLSPNGTIAIHGEYWDTHSVEGPIRSGVRVRVQGIDGRTLLVRKIHD